MVEADLDAVVEVTKEKEKTKLFKEVVVGGTNTPLGDVTMAGKYSSLPKSDQPVTAKRMSKKSDRRLNFFCMTKNVENLRYKVTYTLIGTYIRYMKNHTVIGKFMGIWLSEKEQMVWIKSRWKVKGDIELKLGSKGLFTVIFSFTEDINKVFDARAYLFNSIGFHLRF